MKHAAQKSLVYVLVLAALLLWIEGSASGVILHPDGEPDLVTWTDRPNDDVVGRWGGCASCIAVSSNCVITTRHQTSNVSVEIGGKTYLIAQVWNHSTADLRIAKLNGANLANFIDIYELTDEKDQEIVMGGYGKGRGSLLETGGVTYGYEWGGGGNSTLRFGTNTIDYTYYNTSGNYIFYAIVAYFDGLTEVESTIYECALADYDSGGGWFIKDGDTWKVAGLCHGVEDHYVEGHEDDPDYRLWETWFRKRSDPNDTHPDYQVAVRLSYYAQWIYDTIPEVLPGDMNGDDFVDFSDFAVFTNFWLDTDCHYPDWCLGADFEPDGDVDFADLAEFTYYWHAGEPPP